MYPLSLFGVLLTFSVFLATLCGCAAGGSASEPLREAAPRVKATSFSGPQNAWLVGEGGDLWHTQDGGSSWNRIAGQAVGGRFHNVSFITPLRGWAVGDQGAIWRTRDGGSTWTCVGKLGLPDHDDWVFMGSPQMHFVDENHGWVIETLGVWRTVNGGLDWKQVLSTLDQRVKGQPVFGTFESPAVAVISGTSGEIYATDDGGATWHVKTLLDKGDFRYISLLGDGKGWLIGSNVDQRGTIVFYTENRGEDWRPVTSLTSDSALYSLNFIDDKEGWAVGRDTPNSPDWQPTKSGLVLHTLDGGKTWQRVPVGKDERVFNLVWFHDRQQGWLLSSDKVYRTDDGGKTWAMALNLPHTK